MKKMKKIKLIKDKIKPVQDIYEIRAYISLTGYSVGKNRILLSPDCVDATEVCHYADALIKDLEDIKREATKIKWTNHPAFS